MTSTFIRRSKEEDNNAQDDPAEEELVGAAEKLDTMMAKMQRRLNIFLHLRRCAASFVTKLFQTIAWSYG